MTDGLLMMFAELPEHPEHPGCSSKTCPDFLPLTTGSLWPECVRRWPERVSMRSGQLFERATSAPRIDANDGSVLPAPTASDGTVQEALAKLLPTPAAWDGSRGPDLARENRTDSGGMDLVTTIERLLPTPAMADSRSSGSAGYTKTATHNPGLTLTDACVRGLGHMPKPPNDGNTSPDGQPLPPPSRTA